MKLIIDISDKMFDTFKKNGIMTFDSLDEYDKDILAVTIANGIPYNPINDADLLPRIYKCPKCLYLFNGRDDPDKCPRCGANVKKGGAE